MRDAARRSRGYGNGNQNEEPLPLSSRNSGTVARRPVTAGQPSLLVNSVHRRRDGAPLFITSLQHGRFSPAR
ncbi:hypothetical protein E2C01_094488 [Portunus trituberculatus]|uniref:Uncharacterized protein n=1 Tax=Portunus trituberculatus TaxID=210409 RepID=A0A5B7JSJ5_PORTR|nr:hypothetical protein [Portunus trituberculatus]